MRTGWGSGTSVTLAKQLLAYMVVRWYMNYRLLLNEPGFLKTLQFAIHHVRYTAYIVHGITYNVHCTIYGVQCTWYYLQCTMYIVRYTAYIVHGITYNVRFTAYIVHRTTYNVHCTLYIVKCMYNIRHTVYSVLTLFTDWRTLSKNNST